MPTKKSTPAKKKENPKLVSVDQAYTVEYEYRPAEVIAVLNKENEILRQKLAAYEYPKDPQPMAANKPAPMPTMLTQFCEQMDGQLSRLYNSINTLEATAERLQFTKSDGQIAQGTNPASSDLSTRLSGFLEYFSYQNLRLEDLNAKLNNLI